MSLLQPSISVEERAEGVDGAFVAGLLTRVETGASRKIDGRSALTRLGAVSHLPPRWPSTRPRLLETERVLISKEYNLLRGRARSARNGFRCRSFARARAH